ncbi:UBP18 [Symbiodinium necroappetens]|uniref:UBP18 protein n=1 Tax=Symbiodinium necroappetens TaxID=1628268 RepID=A0A812RSW4_9DINO|nr:UBP18 [Symbiodinium necroappetens]
MNFNFTLVLQIFCSNFLLQSFGAVARGTLVTVVVDSLGLTFPGRLWKSCSETSPGWSVSTATSARSADRRGVCEAHTSNAHRATSCFTSIGGRIPAGSARSIAPCGSLKNLMLHLSWRRAALEATNFMGSLYTRISMVRPSLDTTLLLSKTDKGACGTGWTTTRCQKCHGPWSRNSEPISFSILRRQCLCHHAKMASANHLQGQSRMTRMAWAKEQQGGVSKRSAACLWQARRSLDFSNKMRGDVPTRRLRQCRRQHPRA